MNSQKKSNVVNFYKIFIMQTYAYLAFVPFIFAFFSLLKKHNTIDIIIFSVGVIFLILLLLLNHLEPAIKITPLRIILFSIDRNRPIILKRDELKKIKRVNNRLAIIYFHKSSYEIKLGKKKMDLFIKILEEES